MEDSIQIQAWLKEVKIPYRSTATKVLKVKKSRVKETLFITIQSLINLHRRVLESQKLHSEHQQLLILSLKLGQRRTFWSRAKAVF